MADPLSCLRYATISIAVWNIIYCLLQFGILGWQFHVVKIIIAEYENRQLPVTGAIDGFQARFPGLYQIYTETPERRRANAMYGILIVCMILAIANLLTSCLLMYAAIRYLKHLIWPWFGTSIPLCIMTTVYSVLWWSGDVFNEQLTMSVFEFVMSVAINTITIIVVMVFFSRLTGSLISTNPKGTKRRRRRRKYPHELNKPHRKHEDGENDKVPEWRQEWPSIPDVELQRKMRKRRRKYLIQSGIDNPSGLDFEAPQLADNEFPWKIRKLERDYHRTYRESKPNKIKQLYYEQYPEDLPDVPWMMRKRIEQDRHQLKNELNKNAVIVNNSGEYNKHVK